MCILSRVSFRGLLLQELGHAENPQALGDRSIHGIFLLQASKCCGLQIKKNGVSGEPK